MEIFQPLIDLIDFLWDVLNDPIGAFNSLVCVLIDLLDLVWIFSTPENLTVGALIESIEIPLIGRGALYEIIQAIQGIFVIWVTIKIYKLIPFKAT